MNEKLNDSDKLHKSTPTEPGAPNPSGPDPIVELTKAVTALARVLEEGLAQVAAAIAGRAVVPAAPARPLAKGDRVRLGERRGVVANIGAAGISLKWDNGQFDMLVHSQAAGLVRE